MKVCEREDCLMAAYQKGEASALEEIYALLKEPLYSFVFRYTQDEQFSIDIVQDTFVKLQHYKNNYNPHNGKLKSYIFQIAYRLMITKLNRRKKWRTLLPFLIPESPGKMDIADRMTIREAVANLPDIQRAVVLLFYYHDMSYEEIAVVLDIRLGTVKSRLHSSIQLLKKELGADFYESGSF